MTRWCWLLLLLTLHAHAGEPRVRLLAAQEGALAPGQGLELRVQVLIPSFFLAAPRFPELRLDQGSRAAPGETQNLSEHIDGQGYAGIQRTYRFPPLPPGHYRVLPQPLELRYADAQNRPLDIRLPLPAFAFTVTPRSESAANAPGDSPQLRISERYSPATAELRSGDILLRELRIELQGAGDLLPPNPVLPTPAGTRLYRDAASVDRDSQRGVQTSVRGERLRYLLLTPGTIELPALRLQWRDTRSGRLEQVELPARQLRVLPRAAQSGQSARAAWLPLAMLLAVLAGLAAATMRLPGVRRWRAERHRWQALRRAARANDLRRTEPALTAWLAELPLEVRQYALGAGLRSEIDALQQARYGGRPGQWQPAELLRKAAALRRSRATRRHGRETPPRLNP